MEEENSSKGHSTEVQSCENCATGKRSRSASNDSSSDNNMKQSKVMKCADGGDSDGNKKCTNAAVDIDKSESSLVENNDVLNSCAICMETPESGKNISFHSCPTCKKDAWKICEVCNESRLSRSCPICNGDYAPLVLYSMPSESDFIKHPSISEKTQEAQIQYVKALQFTKLRLITISNCIVWNVTKNALDFSLPVDPTLPAPQIRYMLVTLPLCPTVSPQSNGANSDANNRVSYTADDIEYLNEIRTKLITTSKFEFTNRIWDYLENIMELTHEGDNLKDIRDTMRMIMNALVQTTDNDEGETNVLLTCTNPDDLILDILNQ